MMLTPASSDGERHGRVLELGEIVGIEMRPQKQQQHAGDGHVHRRAGDRHDQLLGRLVGHALHAGNAAERP